MVGYFLNQNTSMDSVDLKPKKSQICSKSAICNSQFLSQKKFKNTNINKLDEILRNFYL